MYPNLCPSNVVERRGPVVLLPLSTSPLTLLEFLLSMVVQLAPNWILVEARTSKEHRVQGRGGPLRPLKQKKI